MRRHIGLLHRARAADVRRVERHAGNELTHPLNRAARRNRVERFAVEHLRLRGRLHIDDRRVARHREGLLNRSHSHVRVHGHGEVRLELHALALHGREPFEAERDGVHARTQIDDAIAAVRVGGDGSDFFDQHRARHFDGHARQHGAARVSNGAGERTLRVRGARQQADHDHRREDGSENSTLQHSIPPGKTS